MVLLSTPVVQPGRESDGLWVDAFAVPVGPIVANRDPVVESHMLIRRVATIPDDPPLEVGITCRVCPRANCAVRREPSIVLSPGQGANNAI